MSRKPAGDFAFGSTKKTLANKGEIEVLFDRQNYLPGEEVNCVVICHSPSQILEVMSGKRRADKERETQETTCDSTKNIRIYSFCFFS